MFDRMKVSLKISAIERRIRRTQRAYQRDYKAAQKAKKGTQALEDIRGFEQFEVSGLEDEKSQVLTRELVREANRLRVPVPREGWETSHSWGYRYLADEAYSALRSKVRQEKIDRANGRLLWMPHVISAITAVTGLFGIFAGLLAVWQNRPD